MIKRGFLSGVGMSVVVRCSSFHGFRLFWTEVGDWHWRLQNFDIDTLTQAVRQHKACECYPVPNLKKVHGYARKIEADNRPRRQTSGDRGLPEERLFIMCVAKDFDGCGPVGHYLPVLMWPFGDTDADAYRNNVEAFARKHADFYGGVWEVFADTSQTEVMQQSREIRSGVNEAVR